MPTQPAPTSTPAPRRERRKEARPGELIDAALELFVSKGFAATRVEAVAQKAGVSKGTLFLYFATKEDLFKAVVRHAIVGRFTEWNAEFDSFPGTTADMVRYAMRSWWDQVGNTQASGISKLIMSEASNFPEIASFYDQEVIKPGNALIRRIIQRGIDRGEFRSVDVHYAVYSVLSAMMFLAMWKHSFGPCMPVAEKLDPDAYLHHVADVIIRGLQRHEGAPT
jgi:TetR/AcrR family transcriptional regulator